MDVVKQTRIAAADTGELIFDEELQMTFTLWTDQGYLLNNNRPAVKLFTFRELPIAPGDKAKVMQLLPYVSRSNALVRADTGFPLTGQMIAKAIGISEPRTYTWLKRMQAAGVIRKHEGAHYFSPLYLMGRSRLTKSLYRIFADQLDLPAWVIRKLNEPENDE